METTLLYILHWILLDSAEECADNDIDPANPFLYLFPIPTLTVSYQNSVCWCRIEMLRIMVLFDDPALRLPVRALK